MTLVGFSMGGGEVARYLGTHGDDRVAGAVVAAAVPPYLLAVDGNPGGGLPEEDAEAMKSGAHDDREGFLDGFVTSFFSAGGEVMVSEEQRQQALALAAQAGDEGLLACIDSFARTDLRGDLEKIAVPTLVIHGDSDAIVPFEVSGKWTGASVAGARTVVVQGGPHGLNVSHAAEFNQALLDFLAR